MHESYLTYFELIDIGRPYCAIRLLIDPWKGLELYLGQHIEVFETDSKQTGVRFNYDLINPTKEHEVAINTGDFHDMVCGIMLAILERELQKPLTATEKGSNGDEIDDGVGISLSRTEVRHQSESGEPTGMAAPRSSERSVGISRSEDSPDQNHKD